MLGMSMSLNDNVLNKPYPPNSITRRRRRRACRTSSSCDSGPSSAVSSKELPRRIKLKLFTSFTSLRQRSCGIYDCMLEYCDHEHKHVHTWLRRAKARNHTNRGYQDRLATFERHMHVLANEGIAYDPRTPGAQLPLNTRHAQLAADARRAWKELRTVEDEAERFDRILEDAANSQRRAWESLKAKLEIAHGQHVLHMSPRLTSRKAIERWLRAGKLTMYGQWILRALSTPTPPPTK